MFYSLAFQLCRYLYSGAENAEKKLRAHATLATAQLLSLFVCLFLFAIFGPWQSQSQLKNKSRLSWPSRPPFRDLGDIKVAALILESEIKDLALSEEQKN